MKRITIRGQKAMADHLGVSKSSLCAWLKKGIFPVGAKLGGVTSPMIWEDFSFEEWKQLRSEEGKA